MLLANTCMCSLANSSVLICTSTSQLDDDDDASHVTVLCCNVTATSPAWLMTVAGCRSELLIGALPSWTHGWGTLSVISPP